MVNCWCLCFAVGLVVWFGLFVRLINVCLPLYGYYKVVGCWVCYFAICCLCMCGCSSLLFALGWWLFGLLFGLVNCFNVCY